MIYLVIVKVQHINSAQLLYLALCLCGEQKAFIDELKKALSQHHGSHSRTLQEGAAVTCVKLCKCATYVNITDRANVLFVLVHNFNQDLKASCLFKYFFPTFKFLTCSRCTIITSNVVLSQSCEATHDTRYIQYRGICLFFQGIHLLFFL